MATTHQPGIADFYEHDVLPALTARLDQAFPEFGWTRDVRGWHASNDDFTHQQFGVRADRVVCHGEAPRGFLIHGDGPVLWTTYLNNGRAARGREFIDTVHELAERAGIDPASIHRPPTAADRKARLLHDAFVISRHELASERGARARAYLTSRGIASDQIADTTLGLIPPTSDLRQRLRGRGYTDRALDASGLFADSRWPGRIAGAWRDQRGTVVTLWTRTIDPADDDRYLYLRGAPRSDGTPYGLSDLLTSTSRPADVTLVEGVLDVHVLRAHGINSIAALGGTSLRRGQFEQLADLGIERLILAFDNDAAGRAALIRAIDDSIHADRAPSLWIIDPDLYDDTGKDPGDVVRRGGADAWHAATTAPVCAITWRALDLTGPIACSNQQLARRAGLNHAEAWLRTLPHRLALEQIGALDQVSNTLGFDPNVVRRAFNDTSWRRPEPAISV